MATVITKYYGCNGALPALIANRGTANIYLALVTSAYTFDPSHSDWIADASANEITGSGYTQGGEKVTGLVWQTKADNALIADGEYWLDGADVVWTNATFAARAGILYDLDTGDLLAHILFDDTPGDVVAAGHDFPVRWPSLGFFKSPYT